MTISIGINKIIVATTLVLLLGGCGQSKTPQPKHKTQKSQKASKPKYKRPVLKDPSKEFISCDYNRKTIEVSLENGRGYFAACENYEVVRIGYVSAGRPSTHRTPRGTYNVQWKAKEYDSKKYPSTNGKRNMDNAMFFTAKGHAMHKGNINGLSHGCVRTQQYQSEWLYDWAPHGTRIVVQDM